MTDDTPTRAEVALVIALGLSTVQHAGRIAGAQGRPPTTPEQIAAITRFVEDKLSLIVARLREPGHAPTLEDLGHVMDMVAEAAVAEVLGPPPGTLLQ